MMDLKDPELKEVVDEFCSESLELCETLQDTLDDFEDDLNQTSLLEKYGQTIDRIMGAAKSIGAEKCGQFSELGKIISYKASQIHDEKLLSIVHAVLCDNTEVLTSLVENIKEAREEKLTGISLEKFADRLKWLADKFSHINRASVAVGEKSEEINQDDINSILKDLGL